MRERPRRTPYRRRSPVPALTTLIKPSLGDQKDTVAGTLNGLRGTAFPQGPIQPDAAPRGKVAAAATRVVDALDKRFGFGGI